MRINIYTLISLATLLHDNLYKSHDYDKFSGKVGTRSTTIYNRFNDISVTKY